MKWLIGKREQHTKAQRGKVVIKGGEWTRTISSKPVKDADRPLPAPKNR